MQGKLYVPETVPPKTVRTLENHLAETHGGFTKLDAQGAWTDGQGDLEREQVTLYIVAGMSEMQAASTADWVRIHSDEQSVMWQHSNETTVGFETGDSE